MLFYSFSKINQIKYRLDWQVTGKWLKAPNSMPVKIRARIVRATEGNNLGATMKLTNDSFYERHKETISDVIGIIAILALGYILFVMFLCMGPK